MGCSEPVVRQFIPSGGIRVHYYSSVKVYLTTFGTCGASARPNESDQYCESLLMPHVIHSMEYKPHGTYEPLLSDSFAIQSVA